MAQEKRYDGNVQVVDAVTGDTYAVYKAPNQEPVLTADGVALPAPVVYDPVYKDLDSANAFTSESGILNRDMIRANHCTIPVSWERLSQPQMKLIMQAVSGKESLQLRYFDFYDMAFKTGKFYATDRQTKGRRLHFTSGRYEISFSFIEF